LISKSWKSPRRALFFTQKSLPAKARQPGSAHAKQDQRQPHHPTQARQETQAEVQGTKEKRAQPCL
jgi:hypothetical protein